MPKIPVNFAPALVVIAISLPQFGCSSASTPVRSSMSDQETTPSPLAEGVSRTQLDNGLTVLVREDHSTPVVAMVTHVKTGYFHETDDQAGISHVIEHMYFNGTPTRPGAEDISRETKNYGGVLNAGTIYDHTSYYAVLPSERWSDGLAVQADAFQNPLFDQDVLAKEMEAILQEARRKVDSPGSYGREKMFELAFEKHRMRRWRIGTEEVLRTIDRDDLVRFYKDHYRPSNTILCITGDVSTAEVLARVQDLYGAHEKGQLRQRGGPAEPKQREFRYKRMSGDIYRNYVFLGFHTPGVEHEDNAALEMLATVLGSGRSSRLVARVKEDLVAASSVSANCYQFDDIGLFEIDAITQPDQMDLAVREILVEVERVKHFGVSAQELARAREIVETAEAFGLEEVLGQARTLVHYEALGDYRLVSDDLNRFRAVTTEDVQRVAREYLTLDNATLLEYVTPATPSSREPQPMGEHLKGAVLAAVSNMHGLDAPESAPSVLPRETLRAWSKRFAVSPEAAGDHIRFDLPHGGTLLVAPNATVPTVSVHAYFRGGRIGESANSSGLTRLMQRVMVKSTTNRSSDQLANEIESLGSGIGRVSNDDYFGFTTASLTRNLPYVFDVMFDVIANPAFDPAELEKERKTTIAAIQGVEDSSGALAVQFMRANLFNEHPYGMPELGTPNVVAYTRAPRIAQHHKEVIHPENLVLVVSGAVDPATVHEFMLDYLADWNPESEEVIPLTAAEFYDKSRVETPPRLLANRERDISKDRAQTAMLLAFPTVPRHHEDAYAFEVLQSVTGGLGGTFFEEIRTKRGLAYQVSTMDNSMALGGYFATFVACSPDSADTVLDLVLKLTNELGDNPPSPESIDQAKNYLSGSFRIGLQTNRARGGYLASMEALGLDLSEMDEYPARIADVTREDLARIAREYLVEHPYALGRVDGQKGRDANPTDQP